MTLVDIKRAIMIMVEKEVESGDWEYDNEGQIVIYTGFYEQDIDKVIEDVADGTDV